MTDKNSQNNPNPDERLDDLFKAASGDQWQPSDGFTDCVLARIDDERKSSPDIGVLALKFLPYAAAASIVIALIAVQGESLESLVYSTIDDPFAIEGIIALLAG